jgi:hypothetical protein
MKRNIIPIAFLVTLLFNSCSFPHYYYTPNLQNVPMFTEKNVLSGDIAGSFGAANSSLEVQAGLSLPAHLALTADYMTGGTRHLREGVSDISKIEYYEGAAGIYIPFNNYGVFELYGGLGKGTQNHTFAYKEYNGNLIWTWVSDGTADLSFSKFFIQPDIGIKTEFFEGAFSCRFSKLKFSRIDVNNTIHRIDELNDLKLNTEPWLLEPTLTIRGGSETVQVQLQIISSATLPKTDLLFEGFRYSLGMHFSLFGKKPEKIKPE